MYALAQFPCEIWEKKALHLMAKTAYLHKKKKISGIK